MATSIIPTGYARPYTHADALLAARYFDARLGIRGRTAVEFEPATTFSFEQPDGTRDVYTQPELLACQWWHLLDAETVLRVDGFLRHRDRFQGDAPICFFALSDRKNGGKLIAGSRLSGYYEGAEQRQAAHEAYGAFRAQHPNAGLFDADSIEEAERLLRGEDVSGQRWVARVTEVRAAQAAVRAQLVAQ
jgi:hypothetical protein